MIRCTINNIEYRIQRSGFQIEEHLGNNTPTVVRIRINEGQRVPVANDIVRIYEDTTDTNLFIGTCGEPRSPRFNYQTDPLDYTLYCRNLNSKMGNYLVNYARNNATVSEIVRDMYDIYVTRDPITLGTISDFPDAMLNRYPVPNLPLTDVLNELAGLVGATWNISNNLEFNFVRQEDFIRSTLDINNMLAPFGNFQHISKDIDLRTVQIITGINERTDLQTETQTYSENQTDIIVTFPLVEMPTISVNGVDVDSSRIGVAGINSDDPNIYFLFSNRSTIIKYNTESNFLNVDDTIVINYFGEFNSRYRSTNQDAINAIEDATGFSGIIENVQNNPTLESLEDAQLFADALLQDFSSSREELSCFITTSRLRELNIDVNEFDIGTIMTFNLPRIDVVGEFVITERIISIESANDAINNLRIDLKFKDRNFIRAYAEDLKNVTRDIRNLNIREDALVGQSLNSDESITLQEEIVIISQTAFFPVPLVTDTNLSIPLPLSGGFGGVYPVSTV